MIEKGNPSRRAILKYMAALASVSLAPAELTAEALRTASPSCASLAIPSALQIAWQNMEVGMFIHFAPNVYYDKQGDAGGVSDPKIFNPYLLDTNQWVDVAESMGAHYIILTAKHVGGFCLWPTSTTDYSIASTPYKNGKGDIVGELAASCKKRGMLFGVYVSPRDDHHNVGGGGKVHSGNPEDQKRYDEIYTKQLTELLTHYGPMVEIWFDGSARGELVGPIVHKYQPNAMIFNTSIGTIRWVGNEEGVAPYPLWNAVTKQIHLTGEASGEGDASGNVWLPAECDVPIRADWFWSTTNAPTLKSLDQLMDIYYKSVGRGANLLLDETPDRAGVIPATDAKRTAEFGDEVRRRFSHPLAMINGEGYLMELDLKRPTMIDHVVIQENIVRGERVREYKLEALEDGQWTTIANGSSIGHKRIEIFSKRNASRIRLVATKAICEPQISKFAVFYSGR